MGKWMRGERSLSWRPRRPGGSSQVRVSAGATTATSMTFGWSCIPWGSQQPSDDQFFPPYDVRKTATHYFLIMNLPGMSENGVLTVDVVEGGILRIKGVLEDLDVGRVERHFGSFQIDFSLPADSRKRGVTPSLRDGILKVEIEKKQPESPGIGFLSILGHSGVSREQAETSTSNLEEAGRSKGTVEDASTSTSEETSRSKGEQPVEDNSTACT